MTPTKDQENEAQGRKEAGLLKHMIKYAVRVTSKEVKGENGRFHTLLGDRFWVVKTEYGPTGTCVMNPPSDVVLFDTIEDATKFARKWSPHPWWVSPLSFDYVPLEPVYSITGWKEVRCGVDQR